MAAQDPFSGQQGWGNDDKGQPMLVVQAPGNMEYAPAVSSNRGSGAVMWMGALLGGSVIASLFLLFVYFDASSDVKTLRAQIATEQSNLMRTKANLSALIERERTANEKAAIYDRDNKSLNTENNELRKRLKLPPRPRPPAPAPRQPDPFAE
jgi:hypothetical protein